MAVCSVVKGIMKEDIALELVNYAGGGEDGRMGHKSTSMLLLFVKGTPI